jgi:hypothetical protein
MTETLAEKTCTPCRGGVPPHARDEALRFQSQAPEWVLRDDARRIERTFRFRNFREALGLGLRDRLVEHQKDQGTARERFHHGQRSHAFVISIRGVWTGFLSLLTDHCEFDILQSGPGR